MQVNINPKMNSVLFFFFSRKERKNKKALRSLQLRFTHCVVPFFAQIEDSQHSETKHEDGDKEDEAQTWRWKNQNLHSSVWV